MKKDNGVQKMTKEELALYDTEQEIRPYRQGSLLKNNYFIGAKYRASNMENQITYMAMMSIQNNNFDERADGIYVSLKANEIRNFTHYQGGSFYERLKAVADCMTGNNMGIVDDELHQFDFITLINRASYSDGVFTIRFANELRDKLVSVKKNFTILPQEIVRQLRKPYSFPLYQLLKSQCYYPASYKGERKNYFGFSIGLSELKLDMGVINSNETMVRAVLNKGRGTATDYDKAVSKAVEQIYKSWAEFERSCLRPTIEEINKVTDIYVKYDKILGGHGGKVNGIDFRVWLNGAEKGMDTNTGIPVKPNDNGDMDAHISDEQKFVLALEAGDKIREAGFKIDYTDTLAICEAASFDLDAICNAVEVTRIYNQHKPLTNVTGMIITAIRKSWRQNGCDSKGEKSSFHNFTQRDYDCDELEKLLLNI